MKNLSKISKYSSNNYDSTQESMNIEAYMRDNSTLAIEEVDEDDPDYGCINQKVQRPRELPHLDHTPFLFDRSLEDECGQLLGGKKRATDGYILIEDNESTSKTRYKNGQCI